MNQTQYPKLALYIDGQWLTQASGGEIPVVNPADESLLAMLPLAGVSELDVALSAVEKGYAVWKKTAANSLPYGLAAYGFTHDLATAHRLGEELDAGMVGINHFGVSQPEAPFGGWKESGFGQKSGPEGLLGYTDVKFCSIAK